MSYPEIAGTVPVGVVTKVKGTGQRISRAMEFEEEVLLLVEGTVTGYGLVETKDGAKLQQVLTVDDLWEVTDDEAADRLLRKVRAQTRLVAETDAGRVPIAGFTEQAAQYVTSADGVLMTPAEIAEARGETWKPTDSFVIEFRDGARGLWPEEFPGQELAAPGGMMLVPGVEAAERDQVVGYLDVDSAEPIAWWSDEDEAERLRVAEERAAADEAAADTEAMELLEAARSGDGLSTPQIDGRPITALRVGEVAAFAATCDDASWLGRALHAERGAGGRPGVLKALLGRMETLGLDPEEVEG